MSNFKDAHGKEGVAGQVMVTLGDGRWEWRDNDPLPRAMATNGEWLIWDTRSYVGNCMLFWGPDRCGYVCGWDEAGRYSEGEAKRQAASRDTDIAVPLDVARQFAVTHVRVDTGIRIALGELGLLPKKKLRRRRRRLAEYPLKTARVEQECCVCPAPIEPGQDYRDGIARRAHEDCARDLFDE